MNDIGIYTLDASLGVIRYNLQQVVGRSADQWTYYTNSELFKVSHHQRRVAIFQIPYPVDTTVDDAIDDVYDHADAILVLGSELHMRTVAAIRKYDRPKICYYLCGFLEPTMGHSRVNLFLDWFITTVHFYKNIKPSVLHNLKPHQVKPLQFEALLGRKKNHRDLAYDFIYKHGLQDQGIVTYINEHQCNLKQLDTNNANRWLWPDGDLEAPDNVEWTVQFVKYYGHVMSLSQVIPTNVYNQTAYSLVCETNFEDDFVFFTEKTVKPILAQRLFIILGNRHHLARLRELGFRTFDGIIDESYDEIEGWQPRCAAALEQLRWLCEQDQNKILESCRDIVVHNFDLMYGHDWYHDFSGPFRRHLLNQ